MRRKVTLLEQDLESAEDRADESTRGKTEAEHQLEETTRENAKLKRDIEQLESMQAWGIYNINSSKAKGAT